MVSTPLSVRMRKGCLTCSLRWLAVFFLRFMTHKWRVQGNVSPCCCPVTKKCFNLDEIKIVIVFLPSDGCSDSDIKLPTARTNSNVNVVRFIRYMVCEWRETENKTKMIKIKCLIVCFRSALIQVRNCSICKLESTKKNMEAKILGIKCPGMRINVDLQRWTIILSPCCNGCRLF